MSRVAIISGRAIIAEGLRNLETEYRAAVREVEEIRAERHAAILDALDEGWTQQEVADATGLTRGRIGQIAQRKDT